MVTMHDIDATLLIIETSKLLKEKNIEVPEFVPFVKTGMHKERPPVNEDWWYIRCASILRTVAIRGPIGTEKLRTKYGGKKNRGVKPEHFFKGSGSIIRNALQALEKLDLIQMKKEGVHKGRVITKNGQKILALATKNASSDTKQVQKKDAVEVIENGN